MNASKEKLLNFQNETYNIWKVIRNDLVSKMIYHQLQGSQKWHFLVLNREIWRFLSKYSITVQNNRLVLKQWTKRSFHLLNYKMNKMKYNVCEIKRNFWLKAHSKVWSIFLITEIPLIMMKNAFYFTLKALFVLKLFKLLSSPISHVEKMAGLER